MPNESSLLIVGSLPPELFSLTKLRQLDLNNNTLTGSIDGIQNLTNLEFLQLHSNDFAGEMPPEISRLVNLSKF
jgi:hypothetical protein